MDVVAAFFLGAMAGACFAVVIVAVCFAARQADDFAQLADTLNRRRSRPTRNHVGRYVL